MEIGGKKLITEMRFISTISVEIFQKTDNTTLKTVRQH